MTTIALVAGMIPLILGTAKARRKIVQREFSSSADNLMFAFYAAAVTVSIRCLRRDRESTLAARAHEYRGFTPNMSDRLRTLRGRGFGEFRRRNQTVADKTPPKREDSPTALR